MYLWKDEMEMFKIENGKLVGSKKAINKIKKITDNKFVKQYTKVQ